MSTHNICFHGEIRKNNILWILRSSRAIPLCSDSMVAEESRSQLV